MNTHDHVTKWIRLVLAATMAIAVGLAITPNTDTPVAEATDATFFPQTGFEIDGNLVFNNVQDGDWAATYGPGTTPGGFPTTGVYYNERSDDLCNDRGDDIAAGGIEVGAGPVWPQVTGEPNAKTDLDAIRVAAEKVAVPSGGGSQINDILYVGFETCNAGSGTFNLTVFIDGGDGLTPFLANGTSTGSVDDYLIIFDFQGGGVGSGTLYDFATGDWEFNATITSQQFDQFMNPDRTVGEVAVNLTSLGIPSDGTGGPGAPNEDSECRTLTVSGQAATPTGGSLNSQVKDLVNVAPLELSNCGGIDITKLAADGAASATDPFHYLLDQIDGEDVHDGIPTLTSTPTGLGEPDDDLSEIDADIDLGDTHSWLNVLSQPDYQLVEEQESLPPGWELQSITCTTTDLFDSDGDGDIFDEVEVVVYDKDEDPAATGNLFLVPPASIGNVALDPASCTIVNDALGITIVKDGAGTDDTVFTFDINNGGATNVPVTINGDSVFQTVPATGTYTITEDDINLLDVGDLQSNWSLANISCVDNEGATAPVYNLGNRTATVVIDGSDDDIICTFTNNQASRIIVEKVTDPDTADTFDFDVVGPQSVGLDDIGNGGSKSTGDITPGDYTITEVLPASDPAWVLTAVDCGDINADGVSVDVTVAAGETLTCEFSNQQQGSITIDKRVVQPGTTTIATNQDTTFQFTGDVPGSILTTSGVTADGDELVANPVMPGSFLVTENVAATPGYTLESVECSDDDSGRSGNSAAIEVASGEAVSCTFTNSRNQATLTLAKTWGTNTPDGTSVVLSASASGPAPFDTAIATTASALNEASIYNPADRSMTIYSGQSITIGEAFAGDIGDGFTTTLDCGALGTMQLTPTGDSRGGTLVVGNTPSNVTCTFDNVPKVAGVTLQKSWVNARTGETADLEISSSPTDASDSAQSVAPAVPASGNSAFVNVVAGDTVTFTETVSNAANYTTTFNCSAGDAPTNQPTGTGTTRSLLIDTDDVEAGKAIICRFVNTRIAVDLTVEKSWINGKVGDAVSITSTGGVNNVDFDATAGTTGSDPVTEVDVDPVTYTVFAGETLTFSELFGTGDPAAYDTSFSCTGPDSATDEVLTVNPAAAANGITCTYENDRRSFDVRVAKTLLPIDDPGVFDLLINGETVVTDGGDTAISPLPMEVFVGDIVTFAEAAGTNTSLDYYGSTVSCDNDIVVDEDTGISGEFEMPSSLPDSPVVICTFTNTRRSAPLTVVKNWADSPQNGDAVVMDITAPAAPTRTVTDGVNSNDGLGNDTNGTSIVYAGESITVAESFTTGVPANYDSTLVCSDESGDLVPLTDSLSETFTVPSTPTAITCTFENVRKRADLTLRKVWTNAAAGDTADLTASGEDANSPAEATSIATLGNSTDNTNVAELTVYAGETVDLDEVVDPSDNYTSGLVCSGSVNSASGADRSFDLAITPADAGNAIVCSFQNVRKQASIVLTKDWATSPANGNSVDLTITNTTLSATDGVNSNNGIDDDSDATVQALVGETITLNEAFNPGDPSNYGITLACVDDEGEAVNSVLTHTVGDLSGELAVDPADADRTITCTFTNFPNPSDVSVTKTVDGGLDAEQAWAFAFTLTPDANPAGSQTASGTGDGSDTVSWTNLVPGEEYILAEVLPGENTTTYDNGELTCTGVDDDDDDPSTVTFVAPLGGDGVEVSCSVTNTAQSDVVYDKVVESVTRDAGTGVWTITYLIEVENAADAGTGVYDLSDTFDFGEGVSIVPGSAAVSGSDGTDPIATNGDFDGQGNDAIVIGESIAAGATHTFEVSVDVTIVVGPGTDGDCTSVDGEGTGFLNTMSIVIDGGEPEGTDACAGFAQLTLVKTLVNDDGGNGTLADFPLTAEGPATLTGVSGTADVSSAVPAGSFALAEEQLVEGYTNDGFVCVGATGSSTSSVTLEDGDNAVCTVTNDDEPVDLELTKDDGGAEAVAGGAPFTYTISVRNIGTRDADLGEPVTVTDDLPAGLVWVSFPANCTQAGQKLTCSIDPALLPAGGDPVVITTTVRAPAGSASGTYVNKASVTTEDDPVCVGTGCTPPPCPATNNNNVDCEETPVDRQGAIQIIKTDNVANGDTVEPGDTFTYQLVVKNIGVSTILPGTNVTDDLPAQLELVSVSGGAGWTCNNADPIDCNYAPVLNPGQSAPPITVTVRVAEDATGANIVNVAVVLGAVDRDCPSATTRLVESFVPACNQVTDSDDERTPLSANADLAIVKSASVAQIGAGGGFTWTLDITNNGPGTAANVVIGDIVPSTLTVTGVSSSDFDCDNTGNTVECTIDSLAVGDSGTVTIAVTVPANAAGGSVTNVGTVESSTPDPDLTNNSDDATVTIVAQAPPTTTLPPVTLPRTGSDATQDIVRIASLFLLLGGAVVLITRRRRNEDVVTD